MEISTRKSKEGLPVSRNHLIARADKVAGTPSEAMAAIDMILSQEGVEMGLDTRLQLENALAIQASDLHDEWGYGGANDFMGEEEDCYNGNTDLSADNNPALYDSKYW